MVMEFNQYLSELFDKAHPWEAWQTGGNLWIYRFALAKVRGGKYIPCPARDGDSIVKFYAENGLNITGRDDMGRPLLNGKDTATPLPGIMYDVTFHTLNYNRDQYNTLTDKANLSDSDLSKIWEIGFSRIDSVLKWSKSPRPVMSGNKSSRWYWDYNRETGTDDDLGIMGVSDASKVLATVIDITKAFIDKAKPSGILMGTKMEAKDARGRIYKAMATRNGGTIIPINYSPRTGMKHANMIWFEKTRKFKPLETESNS